MEGACGLLLHRRLVGFPPESPEREACTADIPHHVGAARYAVAVRVIRVGQSQDAFFRNSLEQPHADGGRRYARRDHHVRAQRAKGHICYRVSGLPQGIRSPVRVLTGDIFIADADAPLGKHAEDGAVLQLSAIDRLVNGAVRPRNAEPQQKAALRVVVVVRRLCPAVVAVAGGTGERVERWAEAVACSRGSRSDDPVLSVGAHPLRKSMRLHGGLPAAPSCWRERRWCII